MAFSPETYALLKGIAIDAAASATTASDAAETATGAAEQAAASAAAAAANSGLAPAFDSTATYAIGDLVLYSGNVYRFTSAHTGAWDAGDVEQTTLGEEAEALDAAKANKTDVATADAALEQMILASFPTDSITNAAVASFQDGADGIPVKALTVNITPVQAGSGDPSPANPRAISGWTGANIVCCGVNLYNPTASTPNVRLDNDGTGNTTPQNGYYTSDYIKVEAGKTYERSAAFTTSRLCCVYDDAKQFVRAVSSGTTVTIAEGEVWIRIALNNNEQFFAVQGATSSSYIGTTYPVSWSDTAGTVYGGTLTDNGDGTWTLTVTQILSQFSWGDGSNPQVGDAYERRTFENAFASVVQTNATNCPNNIGIPYATAGDYARYYIASNGNRVQLYLPVGTSGDLIVQIVGNLAAPVSHILTAESVRTLLGDNNIFADCGDVNALTYRADVGLFIEKKLSEA